MEDFLNEVSENCIQCLERVQRLKQFILEQRKQISAKMIGYRRELSSIMNTKVVKKSSMQSSQDASNLKNVSSRKNSESKQLLCAQNKSAISYESMSKAIDQKQNLNCFAMFQKACANILNIYFPLLMEDQFLSLQSQEQIHQKLLYLNSVVEKTAVNLIKGLTKPSSAQSQVKKQESEVDNFEKEENSFQMSSQNESKQKKIKKQKQKQKKKKGKNTKIPYEATYILQKWLLENFNDPYPTQLKKQQMAQQSGLTVYQVNNWFINARERVIKKFLKKDNCSNVNSKFVDDEDQTNRQTKQKILTSKRQIKSQISSKSIQVLKYINFQEGM